VDDLVKSVAASAASKAGSSIGGCQLRIMLLYEVFAEERATALYPVNTLRNYARLMADTQLVANIDVDMLPSATLSRALLSPKGAGSTAALLEEIKRRNTAYVIPAFETTCGGPSLADQVSKMTWACNSCSTPACSLQGGTTSSKAKQQGSKTGCQSMGGYRHSADFTI
jgi:hypothetical protein